MKNIASYIFSFCLFLLLDCSPSGEKNCAKLKRGEFFYKGGISFGASRISRTDSMQTVTDKKTGEILKEKLVWTDPCTYVLYPFPDTKADILNSGLFPITVSILSSTHEYYTVHVTSFDRRSDFTDTAWIIKLK